jgi:hypothetical protein
MPHAKKSERNSYMRRYLRENPEQHRKHLDRVARNRARARDAIRETLASFRSGGCQLCGEREPVCLQAHHLDPDGKDFNISDARRYCFSVAKLQAELSKCACLCANCHFKVHAGIVEIP